MIGLLGSLALVLAQQPPPIFSTRVELVYVDVFVTKKNAPVTGLESADFRLEDNGVPQQVELLDRAVVPTTAILVLDTSGVNWCA